MISRGCLVAAIALVSTRPALAQEPPPAPASGLVVEGCAVDQAMLARLVRIELASVIEASTDPSRYVVWITCGEGRARIALSDPLTNKTLERTSVAPRAEDLEPERLLALTVAQLYRASWLELAAEKADPPPLPPALPVVRAPKAVESAKRVVEEKSTVPDDVHHVSIAAMGGFRARDLRAPTLLANVEISAAWSPLGEWFWIDIGSGIEVTTVTRDAGTLETMLVKAHGGAAVEPLRAGPWSGFAEFSAGVGILNVASSELEPGYTGGSVLGPGFEGSLGLGAAARIEPIRVELVGRVGLMEGTPMALVARDDPFSLDGVSGGLDLRLRWLL